MLRPALAAPMATLPLCSPFRAAAPAAGRDRREVACTGPDGRLAVLRRLD